MNLDIEKMKEKVLLMADPNSGYTQEDFNKEFGGAQIGTMASIDPDVYKIKLKFANKSSNEDPEYATEGAAGFDLRANLESAISILPNDRAIVPTGLYFSIPEHCEMQIRPRSGLAAKNGVTVLNAPGTIDSDYRGEIKVILINLGSERFVINNNDRIAQATINPVYGKKVIAFRKVDELENDTERGTGGFGSTGTK